MQKLHDMNVVNASELDKLTYENLCGSVMEPLVAPSVVGLRNSSDIAATVNVLPYEEEEPEVPDMDDDIEDAAVVPPEPLTPAIRMGTKRRVTLSTLNAPKKVRFAQKPLMLNPAGSMGGRNLMDEFNEAAVCEPGQSRCSGAWSSGSSAAFGTPSHTSLGVGSGTNVVHSMERGAGDYGVLIQLRPGAKVKVELDELFPGDAGLRHDEPFPRFVFFFHERLKSSTEEELQRSWVVHMHPEKVELTGAEILDQLSPGGELDMKGWTAVWRLLHQLESKMYRGSFLRWRHIFEPQFAAELMSKDDTNELDFEYLSSMMRSDELGYNLKFVKKLHLTVHLYDGWSLYVVDIDKKHMLVMDPAETSEELRDVKAKHGRNACKVLSGLRHAIHECFEGWHVPSNNWTVEYNLGMHESCDREQSGLYIVHYIREFNGLTLHSEMSQGQLEYLGKSLAFQMAKMNGNRGYRPRWLLGLKG